MYLGPYLHLGSSLYKERWDLLSQPLVPGTVRVDVLSGGGQIKISLYNEAEPVASEGKERKYLLCAELLCHVNRKTSGDYGLIQLKTFQNTYMYM